MVSRLQETGRANQQEAAQALGMTNRGFRDFCKRRGVEPDDKEGSEVIYILSQVVQARIDEAVDKAKPDPVEHLDDDGQVIDVNLERSRKLKAERVWQEIKNAEALGELAPIDLMRGALRDCLQSANAHLESVPGLVKRAWPDVPGSVLEAVERECSIVRNTIADGRINYSDERMARRRPQS